MNVAVRSCRQMRNGLYDANIPEKSSVQSRLLKERFQFFGVRLVVARQARSCTAV